MSIPEDQKPNFDLFRDCLDTALIEKITEPRKKERRRIKTRTKKRTAASQPSDEANPGNQTEVTEKTLDINTTGQSTSSSQPLDGNDLDQDTTQPADLTDFTEYIATEIFASLPAELKSIDHNDYIATPSLQETYALPLTGEDIATHLPLLDPDISASLTAYGILHEHVQGINEFLAPVLTAYLTALSTKPPATRADACEICGRDWVNLTYHHLIPRFVHAKAVKRGWHREADLQNVAWLCRACHSFVHRFAGHEELARSYYTVELLLAEEEVRRWAMWVARLRWKGR
ncbi:YisB protein [Xylariaceae sp. FL1019]|nr:YisB protein [Xylariaceae sp. FL1019]